jgi:hypothetical protein
MLGRVPNAGTQNGYPDAGAKVINPIVQNAAPADITGIVKSIDDVISKAEKSKLPLNDYQRRLVELRDDLRGDRPDSPQGLGDVQGDQGLHNVQWKLRAEALARNGGHDDGPSIDCRHGRFELRAER